MTSTVAWSLLWVVYPSLPYFGNALMYATEPWSGSYELRPTLYTTAHTTHSTKPDMKFLQVNDGSGLLNDSGSFVTYLDEDTKAFSVVVETLTFSFELGKTLTDGADAAPSLRAYRTRIKDDLFETGGYMVDMGKISPDKNSVYSIDLGVDEMWTLTTMDTTQHDSQFGETVLTPPESGRFPMPYKYSFDEPPPNAFGETAADGVASAQYWSDQAGVFAIENGRLVQQVPERPVEWSPEDAPSSVIGDVNTTDYEVKVKFQLNEDEVPEDAYVFAGVRVDNWNPNALVRPSGFLLTVYPNLGKWRLWAGMRLLSWGAVEFEDPFAEHEIVVRAVGDEVFGFINGEQVVDKKWKDWIRGDFTKGLAAIGSGWHRAAFDDFEINAV
ncbi:hypothetical protein TrLO_g4995 [Triparma laevis f. longispina]|uniref:Uncharacterized protein n=1 Tax=Triparma laevis f. longispina TaxID=1714387 RepID=A0A9W7AH57_9STRA|nr:hypothetical protein TrLO_g4995 [Triparma laevis f. longispina]